MSIGSITSGSTDTSSLTGSKQTIADNFDTFLNLLTTQLKNQNPLDPLDTNQFTQQLVEFSGIEQQLKTNDFLQSLVLSSQTSSASQAVSFVGKEVTASTAVTDLQNGQATWAFNAEDNAKNATITVKDSDGNTVYTAQEPIEAGTSAFTWDGTTSTGSKLTSGSYQIQVDARDGDGNYVGVTTMATGTVDSVDFSGSEPYLNIGDQRIPLSAVEAVGTPA